jgi:p-hydroxybenzoate 3-monooxygenase
VAIVGAGPAGAFLSILLHRAGIESVLLERRSREYVLGRIRAGVLEFPTAQWLRDAGLGERMDREGFVHEGVNLAFRDRLFRIDFQGLVGRHVVVYGQTEIQKDLYDAIDAAGIPLLDECEEVALHDLEGERPRVTFLRGGEHHTVECDYVAGCDGSHGISRSYVPPELGAHYERSYPFGWLGILSPTPPVHDELIYANHPRGFALCSMRRSDLSRYYLQCPIDTDLDDWPDDRFWEELGRRLPPEVADRLVTGPSIEKSITPVRASITEPLRHGRLVLAGDVGHVMPPTGAKGLNMALADVVLLSRALAEAYRGSDAALDAYSDQALRRVWKVVRFSLWMTRLMHRFEEDGDFGQRLQEAELDYLADSEAAQRSMAENYTGLPLG